MASASLFLSDWLSDIKLQIVGSDGSRIISAHRAIFAQNSYYFEAKFRDAERRAISKDEALIVDVSKEGTVQDVLNIFALFYSNIGIIPDKEERFANLNTDILIKFLIKDIDFAPSDIFENIEFTLHKYASTSTRTGELYIPPEEIIGKLDQNTFFKLVIIENNLFISFGYSGFKKESYEKMVKNYIDFVEYLKNFLQDNNINYRIEINPEDQFFIKRFNLHMFTIERFIIPLIDNENVKILFDKIKEKSDSNVKNKIDKLYSAK